MLPFCLETLVFDDMLLRNYYYGNDKRHPFTLTVIDVHVCCNQSKTKDFLLIKSNFNIVLISQNGEVIHKIGLPEKRIFFSFRLQY